MNPTDQILEYLEMAGASTQAKIEDALGMASNTARNCIVGLVRNGRVRKAASIRRRNGRGGLCAVWEFVEDERVKIDLDKLVSMALVRRSPLELAWQA